MKRLSLLSLSLSLILSSSLLPCILCGCSVEVSPKTETRLFTDSAGREVDIPIAISRIIPSGPYAQMILYTLCPEKLIGLSDPFTRVQKRFIEEAYYDLPIYGKFYGGGGSFNLEGIMKASPDIIIDMGEAKAGIAVDMDSLQSQIGIPIVFIEATIESMADAYETLGEILGVGQRASEMSGYIRGVMDFAEDARSQIPEGARPSVLYSQGEYGNEVNGRGSVHSEVLDYVGAINAADMAGALASGGEEVSMEQIILWNPDIVILSPDSCYDEIYDNVLWSQVAAVKNMRVYEAPIGPYNWMDRPPSVQRVMGILWLGNLIYPEIYDFDIIEKTREYYRLFFRYELSQEDARGLMANSTFR
jgi:iron complex transport system substrate-binding protein